MDETEPPSYDAALSGGLTASAPSINEVFPSDKTRIPASSSYVGIVNEGYEADYDAFRPPTAPPATASPPTAPPPTYIDIPQILLPTFSGMTNEAIRNACYEYVEETCCYGSKAIRDMIISDIRDSCSLHYKLESFGEKRQSRDRETPYTGQYIDGPENGPAPGPWDIPVAVLSMFKDGKAYAEIPHTAVVKQCWRCDGRGEVDCSSCGGDGWTHCSSCGGDGRDSENETCSSCGGGGRSTCWSCSGSGRVSCSRCDGHGKLKHYRELIVTWKNHVDNFVANAMNLPEELILTAAGEQIFKEECPEVSPISQSPDILVNEASRNFITKHRRTIINERILMQRQTLRAIPNTRITYSWRRKEGEFYVYSFEKTAYFENYPQKCCCCICC